MCRMRETNYGSVPAECFGPSMARRVRPLLRLQNHVAGQVFLKGSEAILQRGFLQVSNRSYQFLHLLFFFPPLRELNRAETMEELQAIWVCRIWRGLMIKTNRRISVVRTILFFSINVTLILVHSRSTIFHEKSGKRILSFSILKIETLYSNQSCNSNSNSRKLINYFDYVYIRESVQGVKSCWSKQYEQVRTPLVSNSSMRTCPSSST